MYEKILDKIGLIHYDGKIKEYIKNLIAEVNQNTFSNIKVGTTTISANEKMDVLTLESVDDLVVLSANKDEQKIEVSLNTSNLIIKSDIKPTSEGKLSDIVYNSNPISGDYVGWVYTPSGWFGFGKIEIASDGIELSDGTALILSSGELFLTSDN